MTASASNKYAVLEQAVLLHAQHTGKSFKSLLGAPAIAAALKELAKQPDEKADEWRILDRRLQALRKQGRITYHRAKGWRTVLVQGNLI